MSDCMTFPDTVEEFMEQYKVVDTDQVYSNGTEFVPIFRMKQWFEHLKSAQPEPSQVARDIATIIENEQDMRVMLSQPEIIRCRDCKHFDYYHPYIIQGIPVLGHKVCNAWGDGCKTDENGYCFLAERRTDECLK